MKLFRMQHGAKIIAGGNDPPEVDTSRSKASSAFSVFENLRKSTTNKFTAIELRKRMDLNDRLVEASSSATSRTAGLTLASITQSLSYASEEVTEAFSKTISMFQKPLDNSNMKEEYEVAFVNDEYMIDEEYGVETEMDPTSSHQFEQALTSEALEGLADETARFLQTDPDENYSNASSPVQSTPGSWSSYSFEEDTSLANASRDVSLLDALEMEGQDDEASNCETDVEEEYGEEDDHSDEEYGADASTVGTVCDEDYAEDEDNPFTTIGNLVLQFTSACNFPQELVDDDISLLGGDPDAIPFRHELPRTDDVLDPQMGLPIQENSYVIQGGVDTPRFPVRTGTSLRRGFLETMFSCTG